MGLGEIVPAIFLIAVLILVLPEFLRSNSKSKILFKNSLIWIVIIATVLIVYNFVAWKNNSNYWIFR